MYGWDNLACPIKCLKSFLAHAHTQLMCIQSEWNAASGTLENPMNIKWWWITSKAWAITTCTHTHMRKFFSTFLNNEACA